MDSEVLEGAEQAAFEGAPEAKFCGDVTVEPAQDGHSVGPLGSGGEPQEKSGLEVLEETVVGGGGGVVKFVDDDDVEVIRLKILEVDVGEFLDGGEEVVALAWLVLTCPHLGEVSVLENGSEGGEALF